MKQFTLHCFSLCHLNVLWSLLLPPWPLSSPPFTHLFPLQNHSTVFPPPSQSVHFTVCILFLSCRCMLPLAPHLPPPYHPPPSIVPLLHLSLSSSALVHPSVLHLQSASTPQSVSPSSPLSSSHLYIRFPYSIFASSFCHNFLVVYSSCCADELQLHYSHFSFFSVTCFLRVISLWSCSL